MPLTPEEQTELDALQAEFDAAGGRGVELADRIDALLRKKEGPSKRKFYRTVYEVIVLSEDSAIGSLDLACIAEAIDTGDCVGEVNESRIEEVSGPEMAKMLHAVGSEPGFFRLDDDGYDDEDA